MRLGMKYWTPCLVALCAHPFSLPAQSSTTSPAPVVLDDFESGSHWSALPSEGVALTARTDRGRTGQAMRLDFDFQGRGGFAIARRALSLDLPENYEFSFWIRGDARPNTLEFKLADQSGDNPGGGQSGSRPAPASRHGHLALLTTGRWTAPRGSSGRRSSCWEARHWCTSAPAASS
jgi:carbohydrate binding protein with CBM11 domain